MFPGRESLTSSTIMLLFLLFKLLSDRHARLLGSARGTFRPLVYFQRYDGDREQNTSEEQRLDSTKACFRSHRDIAAFHGNMFEDYSGHCYYQLKYCPEDSQSDKMLRSRAPRAACHQNSYGKPYCQKTPDEPMNQRTHPPIHPLVLSSSVLLRASSLFF